MSTRSSAVAVTVALVPLALIAPHAALVSPSATGGTAHAAAVARAVAGHRITITVTGALPMTKAKMTLKGVKGKAKGWQRTVKVAKRKTVKKLPSGRYRITAAKMTHHGATAKAMPRKWRVSVTGRHGAAVQVVYARVPGAVERVSTTSRDKQANGSSGGWPGPMWSPDGARIAFTSYASNLAPGDTGRRLPDLYVKDLRTGRTTRVWTDPRGGVLWVSPTRLVFFAYSWRERHYIGVVKNVRTGKMLTAPLPRGADPWWWSPNGTAFTFLAGGQTFVKMVATGAVIPVSATANGTLSNDGSGCPVWSPDGTRVAFDSTATNLSTRNTGGFAQLYVKTLATDALELVSADTSGAPINFNVVCRVVWSPDGTQLAFTTFRVPGTNARGLLVKSLATGSLRRIWEDSVLNLQWSPDGSKLLFASSPDYLRWSLVVSDPTTGRISRLLRHYPVDIGGANWSPDGTRVLFSSSQALVPGDTNRDNYGGGYDLHVLTMGSVRITRVSTTSHGLQVHARCRPTDEACAEGSFSGAWSPDGTRVAFTYSSQSSENLVPNDTNRSADVFIKTLK